MGDEIVPVISKPSKTNIMMAKHGRSSNNNTMAINLNSSQPHAMNVAATTTNTTRSLSKNTSQNANSKNRTKNTFEIKQILKMNAHH
jgi:hypothetical protein